MRHRGSCFHPQGPDGARRGMVLPEPGKSCHVIEEHSHCPDCCRMRDCPSLSLFPSSCLLLELAVAEPKWKLRTRRPDAVPEISGFQSTERGTEGQLFRGKKRITSKIDPDNPKVSYVTRSQGAHTGEIVRRARQRERPKSQRLFLSLCPLPYSGDSLCEDLSSSGCPFGAFTVYRVNAKFFICSSYLL